MLLAQVHFGDVTLPHPEHYKKNKKCGLLSSLKTFGYQYFFCNVGVFPIATRAQVNIYSSW